MARWPARVRDVSRTGVGLVYDGRLVPGMFLVLFVEGAGAKSRTLRAKVVRASPLSDDSWLIGCRFVGRVHAEDVNALRRAAWSAPWPFG
jgi:hypothetical protein